MRIVNPLKVVPAALVFSLPVIADDTVDLPDAPNLVLSTVGAHPTFNARNDGFGGNSDVLDATFLIDVDFIDKTEGQRETIFKGLTIFMVSLSPRVLLKKKSLIKAC